MLLDSVWDIVDDRGLLGAVVISDSIISCVEVIMSLSTAPELRDSDVDGICDVSTISLSMDVDGLWDVRMMSGSPDPEPALVPGLNPAPEDGSSVVVVSLAFATVVALVTGIRSSSISPELLNGSTSPLPGAGVVACELETLPLPGTGVVALGLVTFALFCTVVEWDGDGRFGLGGVVVLS